MHFQVFRLTPQGWHLVPNGEVTNNNKVWTRLTFAAPLSALAVRVVEVEAWAGDSSGSAYEVGQWSPQELLDEVPVHVSMLPDGRLLYWGRDEAMDGYDINGTSRTFLWNPVTKARKTVVNTTTNLFCSSHSLLPDGRLLAAGGHMRDDRWPHIEPLGEDDLNIFNPANDTWSLANQMSKRRWYPSSVTLANGDVLFLAGAHWDGTYNQQNGLPNISQNLSMTVSTDSYCISVTREFVENPVSRNYAPTEVLEVVVQDNNVLLKTKIGTLLGVPEEASRYLLQPVIDSLKATQTQ